MLYELWVEGRGHVADANNWDYVLETANYYGRSVRVLSEGQLVAVVYPRPQGV